ncbi:multidrug efflux system outer membrane protein [Novosphingobium capsulatum]|uniref:Multidrug efflux system outer membrane protein n=1 Tax=Novosphingobium capsulatum TaxID=13688 RepID=A0ABU1MPH7_9SPHN|nr:MULTISPECIES: efflux transporter outer membrane subunit [Novosphingobium]KPF55746.1 transporter [Novosphingobium sp. AAP1]MDR6512119.1 multidrug efflux system outer membrane protein [Novosphingobium capsulatum]
MTKSQTVLAAVLPALLLSGCNLAPRYARPAPAVPPALPQGQGVYPAADAAQTQDLARIGWREFFRDDRLRQVIELGLANNQDLRLAVANVQAARAQYRSQRANLFPAISASGSGTYTNTASFAASAGGAASSGPADIQYFTGNVGLSSFEIDLFGRLRNLSKAAQEQYLASEEGRRATRVTLIGEIAAAWLTLGADRDQLATSERTLKAYAQSLDLTKAQFRIGVTSALEMQQAETSYQSARNDIAVLQTQVAQDLNALQLLTGAPVPTELQPQGLGTEPATIDALPGNLGSDVLLRRPDVLQAEHQLIAQNANIGAARAAFFPRISLTATIGTISSTLSNLFSSGTGTYTVSPSASLPLFNFGQNQANLDYAKASRDAAVATYQKTIQTAFREVSDALAQRGTIDEQMAAQTARVQAAQQAAMLSDARFRAGVESFLTALDSQRSAYAAQQQLVTTRLARANNLVTLYRTLGGGLD